jgi:hypothetical protein
MTDIVERLRTTHAEVVRDDGGECDFIAMFREAADEIERLRGERQHDPILLPCPVCGGEAIHAIEMLKRTIIQPKAAPL